MTETEYVRQVEEILRRFGMSWSRPAGTLPTGRAVRNMKTDKTIIVLAPENLTDEERRLEIERLKQLR